MLGWMRDKREVGEKGKEMSAEGATITYVNGVEGWRKGDL